MQVTTKHQPVLQPSGVVVLLLTVLVMVLVRVTLKS
jgi:hypothetical protein